MSSVLIVSKTEMPIEVVQLFKRVGYGMIVNVKSGSEARRILTNNNYEIVLINAPLVDELGDKLASSIMENTMSNVIIISKSDVSDMLELKLEGTGAIVMHKPVSGRDLYKVLGVLKALGNRLNSILSQTKKLEAKVEELKLVSRAKMLLIEKNHMSEDAAHKHIEKTAKDQRITRLEVSKAIISMYE